MNITDYVNWVLGVNAAFSDFLRPVPNDYEPATMGLLGLGFTGLAALRRRRK